jgi:CHRD domain
MMVRRNFKPQQLAARWPTMTIRISRPFLVLAGLGLALGAAPSRAAIESIQVPLTGASQVPAVKTPGTGVAELSYDPETRLLSWTVTYSGLSGPVTMAHFHGPAAKGKNGPVQLWLTKQVGGPVESPIKGQATLTPEQAKELAAGEWYVNVHTQAHPAGEIRGQVVLPKS